MKTYISGEQEISKITDMALCKEYEHVIGLTCDCDSYNVELIGTYERCGKGLHIDIKCLDCGIVTQDGDGDFDDYYDICEGVILHKEVVDELLYIGVQNHPASGTKQEKLR